MKSKLNYKNILKHFISQFYFFINSIYGFYSDILVTKFR